MLRKIKIEDLNKYISFRRLDLIVKYLYAKAILNAPKNDYQTGAEEDLYVRHILMRTMGVEPTNTNKTSIKDYTDFYKKLLEDLQSKGFDENSPIIMDKRSLLHDGAHRLAGSLATRQNVTVKLLQEEGHTWDFSWFEENGFTTEDKMRILKGFVDLNIENSAIFLIWNPLFKYIGNIESILEKSFNIVGSIDLDFEDNYIAFTNALLDIYETNCLEKGKYETILNKAKLLQANNLSFKVIVVTDQETKSDIDIHVKVKEVKEEIRSFFAHILPKEIFATVHSSDSVRECKHLANTLLSPNNIKHLKMRLSYEYSPEFIEKCNRFKPFLKNIGIDDSDDTCVIGSAPMTVLGMQKTSDIDFIIKYQLRDKFGDEITYLGDFDIGVSDRIANRPKNIGDDVLIDTDDYHFYFQGIKFTNIELIKDRKSFSAREKDKLHVRQIELFEKLIGNYSQQKVLMARINQEKDRRSGFSKNNSAQKNNNIDSKNLLKKIGKFIKILRYSL